MNSTFAIPGELNSSTTRAELVIVTGQSGVGKSKIGENLPQNFIQLKSWVNIEERKPRGDKGADVRIDINKPFTRSNVNWDLVYQADKDLYEFLDPAEFKEVLGGNDLLTVAEVQGCYRLYRRSDLSKAATQGKSVYIEAAPEVLYDMINGHPNFPGSGVQSTPNLDFRVCRIKLDPELSHFGLSFRNSETAEDIFNRMVSAETIKLAEKIFKKRSNYFSDNNLMSLVDEPFITGMIGSEYISFKKDTIKQAYTDFTTYTEYFAQRLWHYAKHPTDSTKSLNNPEQMIADTVKGLPKKLIEYLKHQQLFQELAERDQMVEVDFSQRQWQGGKNDPRNGKRSIITQNPKAKQGEPAFSVAVLEPNHHIDPVGQVIQFMNNFAKNRETTQGQIDIKFGLDKQRGIIDCINKIIEAAETNALLISQNNDESNGVNNSRICLLETLASDEVLSAMYKNVIMAKCIRLEREGNPAIDKIETMRGLMKMTFKEIADDPSIDIGIKLRIGEATQQVFGRLKEGFYNRERRIVNETQLRIS